METSNSGEIIEAYLNGSIDNTLDTIINISIKKHQQKHKHAKIGEFYPGFIYRKKAKWKAEIRERG